MRSRSMRPHHSPALASAPPACPPELALARDAALPLLSNGPARGYNRAGPGRGVPGFPAPSSPRRPALHARQDSPLVSVLMATRDRLDLVPGALASVAAQDEPRWELVLVNDGGPSPAGVVARLGDARVRLAELRDARGKGHAINHAFGLSRGGCIAHLDDDDAWHPEHLSTLLAALAATPGARMAHSNALRVDLAPDGLGGWRETGRAVAYSSPASLEALLEYNCVTGISVLHDRALFEQAGGMDEALDVLLDWDLWRRMAALTTPVHVDRVTAEYFVRAGEAGEGAGGPGAGAHLTGLARRDPVRYVRNRLRILDKPLPLPRDGSLDAALAGARARGRMQLAVALGEAAEAGGDVAGARAHYEAGRDAAPEHALPWRKLGRLAASGGEPEAALRAFGKCLALPGAAPTDALHAAGAAMALGEPRKALGLLEAAARRFGPQHEGQPAVLRLLAQVRALAR